MQRKVLLPRELERRLDTLAKVEQEVGGVLLYRQKEIYCPLEKLFITGVGSVGNVQSIPERMEIVNEFFKRNTNYRFVKFHTHSVGTIRECGEYFATHFSQQDIEGVEGDGGMKQRLREDSKYIAMLVTPETKLLYGNGCLSLRVVNEFRGYRNRSRGISQSLRTIAKNLGYDIDNLPATMRG